MIQVEKVMQPSDNFHENSFIDSVRSSFKEPIAEEKEERPTPSLNSSRPINENLH